MVRRNRQNTTRILITQLKLKHMNVNDLMNMNDMYYVGNIVDVDGDGWVNKSEAQAILDELGVTDTDPDLKDIPNINFK